MSDHVAIDPVHHDGWGWLARCSCGWNEQRWDGWATPRPQTFEEHREEALKPVENACRYCAAPIPWGHLFCQTDCEKASKRNRDAVESVLDAHREDEEPERIIPSPDQGALW